MSRTLARLPRSEEEEGRGSNVIRTGTKPYRVPRLALRAGTNGGARRETSEGDAPQGRQLAHTHTKKYKLRAPLLHILCTIVFNEFRDCSSLYGHH